jgi:hypothetical protein
MADRIYSSVGSTVTSVESRFHSHSLQEEGDNEYILEEIMLPQSDRKKPLPLTKETLMQAMEKSNKGKINPRIFQLAWKNRKVFDPIEPGGVRAHEHTIDLNTKR